MSHAPSFGSELLGLERLGEGLRDQCAMPTAAQIVVLLAVQVGVRLPHHSRLGALLDGREATEAEAPVAG